MKSSVVVTAVAAMVAIGALGVGVGWGIGTTVPAPAAPVTVTSSSSTQSSGSPPNSSSAFDVTLVITTGNSYNSTVGAQPAYYLLGPSGLESAAQIALPANQLIKLTIICYDDGSAAIMGPQYATVTGTQNDTITEVDNSNVNSSQGASGIQVSGPQNVSSLNSSDIAHTFTIPQLGINIPIAPSSTTVAYFTTSQAGTYSWFCETMCGSGSDGLEGAMDTPGWMLGAVAVS